MNEWTKGSKKIQAAIEGVQTECPKGFFYRGKSVSWSNDIIRSVVDRYLSAIKQAVIIDFHTGLGKYGAAEIITDNSFDCEEVARALTIWSSQLV